MSRDRFHVSVEEPAGAPVGRVLVLPGSGYTVDHPLLFWASQVALDAGWRVASMRWTVDADAKKAPGAFVTEAAEFLCASTDPAPVTVVLAKSLGTHAAPWATTKGYPGIWLTPILRDEAIAAALSASGPPALTVGGTADALWGREVVPDLRGEVVDIAGANHGLHVGTDWRASLAALHRVLDHVERFLSARARGVVAYYDGR
ncbi:hypothetical protein [Knoellia subterranea]|uniref:Alpha/beta hydrolase n=1 Tax=Knoellia subterranea KCTC 19937 TaxID=1385521 RepID=A0A0A0JN94_9MICO|nr:hypothetical protein [Knoellia subterranea]KGN37086.1 hypothetical protein N803_14555 [Knoellia subterranea KCTC 19937]